MNRILALVLASAAFFPTAANAWWHGGNPKLTVWTDRITTDLVDGDAYLDKVRVYKCGGGFTDYSVGETVDPVVGHELTINGGNLCGVRAYWDSAGLKLNHSSFGVNATNTTTYIPVTGPGPQSTTLSQYTVTWGEFSGTDPNAYVYIK